jgi:Ca2+-binding EF-hand superfamily protein
VFDRERKGFISAKDMKKALFDAGDTSNVSEEELQSMIRATCDRDNFEYEDYKVHMVYMVCSHPLYSLRS